MKRIVIFTTAAALILGAAGPAAGQVGATEIVRIDPTSGPLGTEITVTLRNCPGANSDGTARLDFAFNGFTPANTVMFYGDASGAEQTVKIEALGGEGKQRPGQTDAYVALSQCKALGDAGDFTTQQVDLPDGEDSMPFTVTYADQPPATTSTTLVAVPVAPRGGVLPKTGGEGGALIGALLLGASALLVTLRRSALGD